MSEQEQTNDQLQLTPEQVEQLSQFVAGKMFQQISFNYVLNLIENQCVTQGRARIAEASPEQLQQIYSDFQTFQLEQQLAASGGTQGQVETPEISEEDLDTSLVEEVTAN